MPSALRLDLNSLIVDLLTVGQTITNSILEKATEHELTALCAAAKVVFLSQPSLIEVEAPIRICGDTHGQYDDVLRLFDKGGFPPTQNYMFLGDYVDRGEQSLETILLLFCYKVKYPGNFFLLRGNHECSAVNRAYGFYDEVKRRCGSPRLWHIFQDVFNAMPLVGLVSSRILCMHGGLSPRLESLAQLRELQRPIDPPNPSLHIDLLWSDPELYVQGWHPNNRGVSFCFGKDVVKEYCEKLNIDLIARAHQVVQDGYEFFADRRLVTLFSAPHYCGTFGNCGAILCVDAGLQCSFLVLQPEIDRVTAATRRIRANPNLLLVPRRTN